MISVVINTLNEEKKLPGTLDSVKSFADEVIVCDMYSDDGTSGIAEKFGAKVFMHKRMGYVEPARNFAISKAKGDWILVLDADEIISDALKNKLTSIIKDKKSADYYRVPRKNIIFGKWIKHARWWPDYNIRFFKRGCVSWSEIIHSIPITSGKGADLESKEENAILHHNYLTVDQYIERLNRYTTFQVRALLEKGYKFRWTDLITEPTKEFVGRFFQGEGYKDGIHGFALSILQAFSEFVLYLKLWQNEKFKTETVSLFDFSRALKKGEREINYWVSDSLLRENGGFVQKVKRKFRII